VGGDPTCRAWAYASRTRPRGSSSRRRCQRERLLDAFVVGSRDLRGKLAEFIRKHDLPDGEGLPEAELTAPKRADTRIIGKRPPRPPRSAD
jgi:hypothetical protein